MKLLPVVALIACAVPAAASAAIVVEHPQIRPTLGSQATTAAYMTIRNTGAQPDRLVGASCACAASVMPHRTTTVNGVSRMEMEMAVPIPAHGMVVFDARGRHLMLTGVKAPIRAGAKVPMVLKFEKAGRVAATFAAADLAGMAGMISQTQHGR
jgi:copper(I)-binding protein